MYVLLALAVWLLRLLRPRPQRPRPRSGRPFIPAARPALHRRKPEWVIEEIVRLKALMPGAGCRRVADTFNRLHATGHAMTVSKTWVAVAVRRHRLSIEELRSRWRDRIPPPCPANRLWGVDLTGKTDMAGVVHPILGIVDHGSRFAVGLTALQDKSTLAILRALLDIIERRGRPRIIRTDNEAVFTSRLFRMVLAALGIAHQRTEPHCPWQNGRVERFFGTLTERLDRWAVAGLGELEVALQHFGAWYNHVRPHQHLLGHTPAEAWKGIDPFARVPRTVRYFSAWDGMLTGFYLRH